MRVVRVCHAARDPAQRARDRALVALGVELRLIVPSQWPGPSSDNYEPGLDVVELDVTRPGDINRYRFSSTEQLHTAVQSWRADVVDIHEEPVSLSARQVLKVSGDARVVMYSAQNLDKRWPPPFGRFERQALQQVDAFYPCSRQAASVLRGKGYAGIIRVLPLGVDDRYHYAGLKDDVDAPFTIGLVGRLVPEKGLTDALEVLAALAPVCRMRLLVIGEGPQEAEGRHRAAQLGVADLVSWFPWTAEEELAKLYKQMHVLLVPSRTTSTWVEQFGRVITEGAANGAVPIGYASGSIPEVIGDMGLIVPEGDVGALVQAVWRVAQDGGEVLRCRGIKTGLTHSWGTIAMAQLQIYFAAASLASAPTGREAARAEFGLPARTVVSNRPMALPMLRSCRILHRVLDSSRRL